MPYRFDVLATVWVLERLVFPSDQNALQAFVSCMSQRGGSLPEKRFTLSEKRFPLSGETGPHFQAACSGLTLHE
jgi:hypothetical protein